MARAGRTFSPVEGNTGDKAADVFVRQDGATWCVAVFNYRHGTVDKRIDLARAGINGNFHVIDLWNGDPLATTGPTLVVHLNAKQAKLLRTAALSTSTPTGQGDAPLETPTTL